MALDNRTKAQRKADSDKRHIRHAAEVNTGVANAMNLLAYEQKVRGTYFLLNMISLWIKWPKNKQTMEALRAYAWRMNNGKQKTKENSAEGTVDSHTHGMCRL